MTDKEIVERYEDYIGIKYRTQGGETTEMVYVNPCLEKAIANVIKEYTKLKAERDKAVEDISSIRGKSSVCHICKFVDLIGCCHKKNCFEANEYFKWRGLEW